MSRVLNRWALEDAGIEYFPEVANLEPFSDKNCPQWQILARYLLNFKHTVTRETRRDLERKDLDRLRKHENMVIPKKQPHEKSKQLASFVNRYDIRRCHRLFDLALKIKETADGIVSRDEKRWSEVHEQLVFRRYIKMARSFEGALRKPTAADVLQRFRAEQDHLWEFGREVLDRYCQPSSKKLTAPKPDLSFSFHACARDKREVGPLGEDDYVQNLSVTRLCTLYEKYRELSEKKKGWKFGFIPSPFSQFYSTSSMKLKYQQCFPWLVCEWKHHGKEGTLDEDLMHCQAANGAAVCLTLLANAAAMGYRSPILKEIRPVVCMTFVGPKGRVWIAYVASIDHKRACYRYRMQCIWEGSLKSVLDNIMLSIIIERVHFWAMNHLRPWLSSCIDQWNRMIDEQDHATESESETSESSDEDTNFGFRRANTLDDFVDKDDDEDEDEDGSYVDEDEYDQEDEEEEEDLDSEESPEETEELEQEVEDLSYLVHRGQRVLDSVWANKSGKTRHSRNF